MLESKLYNYQIIPIKGFEGTLLKYENYLIFQFIFQFIDSVKIFDKDLINNILANFCLTHNTTYINLYKIKNVSIDIVSYYDGLDQYQILNFQRFVEIRKNGVVSEYRYKNAIFKFIGEYGEITNNKCDFRFTSNIELPAHNLYKQLFEYSMNENQYIFFNIHKLSIKRVLDYINKRLINTGNSLERPLNINDQISLFDLNTITLYEVSDIRDCVNKSILYMPNINISLMNECIIPFIYKDRTINITIEYDTIIVPYSKNLTYTLGVNMFCVEEGNCEIKTIQYGNGISSQKTKIETIDLKEKKIEDIIHTKIINDQIVSYKVNEKNELSVTIDEKLYTGNIYGYKAVTNKRNEKCILELYTLPDSKVAISLKDNTKFRTNKIFAVALYVLDIINEEQNTYILNKLEDTTVYSCIKNIGNFEYNIGNIVEDPNFDPSLDTICVPGIHFCTTIKDAIRFHNIFDVKIINDIKYSVGYPEGLRHRNVNI